MELDDLIARSRDPGAFVERQRFTLSRSQAVEKMRAFTLREPEQYVLELVQAGVFAGARWLFVDTDEAGCTVGWVGGRALRREQLDGLLDYLFVAEGANPDRHLRQLAVAVNVLLRREPVVLRLESGDAQGSARLDVEADGGGVLGVPEHGIHGTYLHVRFREPGWFFRPSQLTREAELIETECGYSPVPIFLNGDGPLGWDRHLPLSNPTLSEQVTFDHRGRDGVGRDGWIARVSRRHTRNPQVTVVVGGVRVAQREIPELGPQLVGVIRDDGLAKTADMSDIVADHRWIAALRALQPAVTELLRKDDPGFEPVDLAEVPVEADEQVADEVVAEVAALDEGLARLGGLAPLPLGALDADEALYWVTPDEADAIVPTLGPAHCEARVVVLDPARAQELAARVPGLAPHRVRAEDAAFVAAQIAKGREAVERRADAASGVLRLRAHRRGGLPGWRGATSALPALLIRPDGSARAIDVPLSLPGVSAIYELDGAADPDVRAIADAVEHAVWALALEADDPALTLELVAQAVHLLPVPGDEVAYRVCLPSEWPPEAHQLLDRPLAEGGPSARALLETLATDQVVWVQDEADAERLQERLAGRVAPGHLAWPGADELGWLDLGWDGVAWAPIDGVDDGVLALLRVAVSFQTRVQDGWERLPTPHPCVFGEARVPQAQVDLGAGLAMLTEQLARIPLDEDDELRTSMVRLALLALAPERARLPVDAQDAVGLTEVASGRVFAALRGGPPGVRGVQLTVDEWSLLARRGVQPRWRVDDPPELWSPLPRDEDWLLTQPVEGDHARGWIGLRHPYDPTSALLVREGLGTRVLPLHEHRLRCHGWVRLLGAPEGAGWLDAPGLALIEALAAIDLDALPPDRRQTATRYAADFCVMSRLFPALGVPAPVTRALGARVPLGEWGDLNQWLRTPDRFRPPLPFQPCGSDGRPIDAAAMLRPETDGSLTLDALRVVLARARVSAAVALYINPEGWACQVWEGRQLNLALAGRSSALRRAEEGDRRAMALVLLDAAWRLYTHETQAGVARRELHELQLAVLSAIDDVLGPDPRG